MKKNHRIHRQLVTAVFRGGRDGFSGTGITVAVVEAYTRTGLKRAKQEFIRTGKLVNAVLSDAE